MKKLSSIFYLLIVLIIMVMFAVSCSHAPIIYDDDSASSIESNLKSLELIYKGRHYLGLMSVNGSESLSAMNIYVKTIQKGDLTIYSKNCHIDDKIHYEHGELVKLDYRNKIEQSCFVSISMKVELDNQKYITYPFSALIFVNKHKIGQAKLYSVQYEKGSGKKLTLKHNLEGQKIGYTAFGCGIKREMDNIEQHRSVILLNSRLIKRKNCLLHIVFYDNRGISYFKVLVNVTNNARPIARASVSFKDLKVLVTPSNDVSIVSIGNREYFRPFKYAPYKQGDYIRLITLKGRQRIGKLDKNIVIWDF